MKELIEFYSISKDEAEYKGRKRLATSEAVELSETRRFLLTKASSNLNEERVVYVVLDESEIPKPNSKKFKKLIKVRGLDRGFINGYRTFNALAVSEDGRRERIYLMTDLPIVSNEKVYEVFKKCYFRWKIESVSKFLKKVLGWEEFQIRELKAIKSILTITYHIGSYLYEIGEVLVGEEFVELVAHCCKGKTWLLHNHEVPFLKWRNSGEPVYVAI